MATGRHDNLSSFSGISADEWMQSRRSLDDLHQDKANKYSFLDEDSSDSSFSESHFIKKNYSQKGSENKESAKQLSVGASSKTKVDIRPKTSHGRSEPRLSSTVRHNSAVDRFAELEKQILSRHTIEKVSLSISDLDISSDLEIKNDVEKIREERNKVQKPAAQYSFLDSSSSDGDDVKFVLPAPVTEDKSKLNKPQAPTSQPLAKAHHSKKTVSFASNLVQDPPSRHETTLDEFLPSQHSDNDSSSLDDVLPSKNLMNLKSFDDLSPYEDEDLKSTSELLNLHSAEELEVAEEPRQLTGSDGSSSSDSGPNLFNVHSIDELDEAKSNSSPEQLSKDQLLKSGKAGQVPSSLPSPHRSKNEIPAAAFKSFKAPEEPVRASLEEVPELDEYTTDFDSSSDHTVQEESIAQDVRTASFTKSSYTSSPASSVSSERTVEDVSYTESFESEEATDRTESFKPEQLSRIEIGIQTDPSYTEQRKNRFEDIAASDMPIFHPSQLLKSEVLSAMTTYSPAVLAVQDIVKQQLQFTRDFVGRSERMHKAARNSLVADYQYASLEEARECIRQHRALFST